MERDVTEQAAVDDWSSASDAELGWRLELLEVIGRHEFGSGTSAIIAEAARRLRGRGT